MYSFFKSRWKITIFISTNCSNNKNLNDFQKINHQWFPYNHREGCSGGSAFTYDTSEKNQKASITIHIVSLVENDDKYLKNPLCDSPYGITLWYCMGQENVVQVWIIIQTVNSEALNMRYDFSYKLVVQTTFIKMFSRSLKDPGNSFTQTWVVYSVVKNLQKCVLMYSQIKLSSFS